MMRRPTRGVRTRAQAIGDEAESAATRLLERRGLAIVARNYRTRFGEIDLIARDGATLVFVEVRYRRSSRAWGGAADSVDHRKRQRLAAAARQYLARLPREPACRFDLVAMQGEDCTWVRGAFEIA